MKHKCSICGRARVWFRTNRLKLKREVMEHYGGNCACCGEKELAFLTIDHKNGEGSDHRRRNGKSLYAWIKRNDYPTNLQVLCYNCNAGRWINKGICPHRIGEDSEKRR